MLLFLCLLLLPSFIDASPEMLKKIHHFHFSTFNQEKYMEGIMAISLNDQVDMLDFGCKTFFCHLQEDEKCYALCKDFAKLNATFDEKQIDTLVTAGFPAPTTSEADCINRFSVLFHKTHDFSPLCKFHYKCEKHELYEKELSQFGSVVRSHLPFYRDQERLKKPLDDLKTGVKTGTREEPIVMKDIIKKYLNYEKSASNETEFVAQNQTLSE